VAGAAVAGLVVEGSEFAALGAGPRVTAARGAFPPRSVANPAIAS
jgi:hypothetical protein